jgi:DNA-binding NtrC family response regulator
VARQQTVLLLARDGLTRKVTSAALAMFGHEVLTASNGELALETIRTNKHITMLVIDADMDGDVSGIALARTARGLIPKVDVIYTSRAPHRIPQRAMVSGAPILRDPYQPHQLVGVIAHLKSRSPELVEQSAA